MKVGKSNRLKWVNPLKPNQIYYSYQLDQYIAEIRVIVWYFCYIYWNFDRILCKQTKESLIRRRIPFWVCTVCLCPTKQDVRLIWIDALIWFVLKCNVVFYSLKANTHQIKHSFKDRICMSNQFAANFVKFYQEIRKLYAFEVSVTSLMHAAIFVSLWHHYLLIIYSKMKYIRFEKISFTLFWCICLILH